MEDQTAGAGSSQPQQWDFPADMSPTTRQQHIHLLPTAEFRPPHHHGEDEVPLASLEKTHSRVSMGFFDPEGVRKLSRTLSRLSAQSNEEPSSEEGPEISEDALKPGGDRFDFGKAVKVYLRKYVLRVSSTRDILNAFAFRRGEAGIKTRQLGVLFENLGVVGLGASASHQQTLGSIFNPMNIVRAIQYLRHPPLRDILTDFEGVIRPGEMLRKTLSITLYIYLLNHELLVVLGRPGSGCTTLLKTLANRRSEYYAITGDVCYDSLTPSQIRRMYRGDVQYCPEDDILFPTLTVDNTIYFAAQTRAPQPRIENQTRQEYTRLITDVYTTIFGLSHVKGTLVGDAAIRGVSGGEKKRVSISETLATRSLITSWDK